MLITQLWLPFTWTSLGIVAFLGLVCCTLNWYLTSAVLHRGLCHRAISFPRWLSHSVATWLWLTACVTPLTWIAAHLHHHAKSDTHEDPHAPGIKGFWRVTLLTWYYVPQWMSSHLNLANERYLKQFGKNSLLRFLNMPSVAGANFYGQIVLSLILGPLTTVFWICRIVPYMFFSGYMNAAGHRLGVRPYNNLGTDAHSWVQKLIGYLVGGEPLGHNYHHAFPSSATFRPRAFDPGLWFATRVLRGKTGVAKATK
jgi:fatty-acid desaturase